MRLLLSSLFSRLSPSFPCAGWLDWTGLALDIPSHPFPQSLSWHLIKLPQLVLKGLMAFMLSVEGPLAAMLLVLLPLSEGSRSKGQVGAGAKPSGLETLRAVALFWVLGYQVFALIILGNLNWGSLVHISLTLALLPDPLLTSVLSRELVRRWGGPGALPAIESPEEKDLEEYATKLAVSAMAVLTFAFGPLAYMAFENLPISSAFFPAFFDSLVKISPGLFLAAVFSGYLSASKEGRAGNANVVSVMGGGLIILLWTLMPFTGQGRVT